MAGRKIDDHSSWMGKGNDESPLPKGVHNKMMSSSDGMGELSPYEDTEDAVKAQQMNNKKKMNSLPQKPGYRN